MPHGTLLLRHFAGQKAAGQNVNIITYKTKKANLQDDVYKNAIVRKLQKSRVYENLTDFRTRFVKKRKIFS